jgi:leucyl aminopeptidase
MVSSSIADEELLGIFANSIHLSNYENCHKKQPEEDSNAKEDEDADPRTKRVTKKIENISITAEKGALVETDKFNFHRVTAKATETARNLANCRGSIATPAWMEDQIRELVKKHEGKIKELRVLDSQQLQDLGMNLFYNVGKGAQVPPRCVIVNY